MKKYICTAMALLMAASLFVGCGCTRNVNQRPDGMITESTIAPTTNPMPTMTTPPEESTRATTEPTTHRETTEPTHRETSEPTMIPEHTGAATEGTDGTHSDNSRSARSWPDRHS